MAEPENIVLTHLVALRNEMADIKREMRDGFKLVHTRLDALDGHVSAIILDMHAYKTGEETLKQRIERIEARLELRDQ
jgi:hypothetical protein